MPLSLANQAVPTDDPSLRVRVAMAFYRVAREIYDEPLSTPGHPIRVNFAKTVYASEYKDLFKYGAVIAGDPTIVALNPQSGADLSDQLIIDTVRENWNAIAGFFPNENM